MEAMASPRGLTDHVGRHYIWGLRERHLAVCAPRSWGHGSELGTDGGLGDDHLFRTFRRVDPCGLPRFRRRHRLAFSMSLSS
jgi:hypothetical protein